jgi:hypothetical protein
MADSSTPGLSLTPQAEWPKKVMPTGMKAVDWLKPNSDAHALVLGYLIKRLEMSERSMSAFYDRWRVNELKYQAYITLEDYEKILEESNKKGKAPQVISICVPYAFATISTIVTYLIQTFCGQEPIFQARSNNPQWTQNARNMERMLQYQAEHTRLVRHVVRNFLDGQVYGVQIMRTAFVNEMAQRTVIKEMDKWNLMGMLAGKSKLRQRQQKLIYSGNEAESIDPFMFFPDPRVPMTEVNRRGEFVFWRGFDGKHLLLSLQAQGKLKWVDQTSTAIPVGKWSGDSGDSNRTMRSQGEAQPGTLRNQEGQIKEFYQRDQGTVNIIPKELGLGDSTLPEKWIFTILNKSQIVQAEPYDCDHGMHPVAVAEPYELGYGFGNCGIADYLGPLQDTVSWFINSHIYNVRAAMNNMFIVDPSMVEMQDVTNPDPGKIIRLKRAAYGQDVRTALTQLVTSDMTSQHINDAQVFIKMGQYLTAVTDNMMGIQEEGGRKTASEVRIASQAGASRLATQARTISAQQWTDIAMQWSLNTQQFMSPEFEYWVLGEDAKKAPISLGQEQVIGDFNYPINDGTLPIDNVALLEVWKEILMGVAQDPELRQTYSISEIFSFVASLGGARNIETFKIQMTPQGAMDQPGMVPLGPQSSAAMLAGPGAGAAPLTPPMQ